jgi:hypothetical protein
MESSCEPCYCQGKVNHLIFFQYRVKHMIHSHASADWNMVRLPAPWLLVLEHTVLLR